MGSEKSKAKGKNISLCGEHLKKQREILGLSQDDLCDKLGGKTAKNDISDYENDKRKMRADTFRRLVHVLGCTPDYLQGKSTAPNRTAREQNQIDLQKNKADRRKDLLAYIEKYCFCSIREWKEGRFDIMAEICAPSPIDEDYSLQEMNCPFFSAAEIDMLADNIDRAIENACSTFVEMRLSKMLKKH